ncbi:hypothetical protein OEA41_010280 [Lepraria neglecta]|uniref:Uncharacterized protein n=1 Tax=Lepraria neglecta TaxID=209136 RepID=A0AAE0DF53_9LECA|nr:hypothetical protein OEA41_010280 [Lepraria neglecta]
MLKFVVDLTQTTIMPGGLDYDKHGRIARVKPRSKDSDNRSIISSSSSRRHRDSSDSSSRTPLPTECSSQQLQEPKQHLEHTSSSASLDQLPKLPESDPNSPSTSSSPLLRTISNVSTSTAVTSPTLARVPINMQAFLESDDDDLPTMSNDSQLTPKPEKTKEQCEMKESRPKALIQPPVSDNTTPKPVRKSSAESTKTALSRSSSRTGPPPSLKQDQPHKQPHHRETKQPELLDPPSSFSTPAPVQPPPYGMAPPGQQGLPPQFTYAHMPPIAGPSVSPPNIPPNIPPQGLFYYPDYGPPAPQGQAPPQLLQYPPAIEPRAQDNNPMALLHRVHCAMPDLHTLLDSYQDMCGLLEAKEVHIRKMEAQRVADQRKQGARITQLEKDLESILNKHSAETNELKHEVSTMDKRCKDVQDRLTVEMKHSDALQVTNESLRAEQKQAEKRHSEDKTALNKGFSHEMDKLVAEHRTNQRAMHEQLQAQMRKTEATFVYRLAETNRAHEEEMQHLENNWTKQRRELEDRQTKAQRDLDNTLEAKQKVVDEERRSCLQAREGWEKERDAMRRRFDEECSMLQKASEEQQKALTARFQREKDDILRQYSQMQNRTEQEDIVLRLQREIETLRAGWDTDKFRIQKATADFKTTARTLNEQNNKLQKLTEAFADTIDVKGK